MKQLEKLMLTVGLLDKITGPMRSIQRTIRQVTDNSRKAFMNTAAGVTALIAASTSFASTVNPANDVNNALREVSSLEVADDTLNRLNQAGLQYSIQFGDSAANFVRSAYNIKSGISELAEQDLPAFTNAAGVLAKATKANVEDITSYFGLMFNVFKKDADAMGAGKWIEQLAGQTATAVQMYKTTGPEMAAAFESLGQMPTSMGVSMTDQIAALGRLQNSMGSGSEAGTAFGAFIDGVSGAGEKLGVSFENVQGNLLPIVDILQMINGRINGMSATEKNNFLSEAFGGREAAAAVIALSANVQELNGDIANLAKQDGMEKAIWMAERMQDPWARLAAGVQSVSIAIWQKALPVIEPYINQITTAMSVLVEWADKYPHLTKAVGLAATAFIGFVAIAGIMNIAIGMARFAMVGFTMRFILVRPIVWGARLAVMAFTGVVWLLRIALLGFVLLGPVVSAFFTMLKTSFLTAVPVIWAFTAALLANPLTWIVVGVVAVIAAIAALIYYWDEVTAAVGAAWSWLRNLFEENGWMKFVFAPIYLGMNAVDAVLYTFEKIPEWWKSFSSWFSSLSFELVWDLGSEMLDGLYQKWMDYVAWFDSLVLRPVWDFGGELVGELLQKWGDFQVWLSRLTLMPPFLVDLAPLESIKAWFTEFKTWLGSLNPFESFSQGFDWMRSKLSWLPGIDAPESKTIETVTQQNTEMGGLVLPGSSSQAEGEKGGLFQTISNMFGGSSNSTHVERIEVHNHATGVRGDELAYELEMAAG